ncbi:AMP-binding protein [Rudaeicoccus suwonensis]|uniref:Acyl-CoA synthetase (AMP-forming)/AMP-acid ligase II n=1 Tax=Rudaeicoccus suwonensis TaxID=657409 RepID=A0A561DVN4_9MICO|nr:AMP-binding protein [Rudaeicoccus suwonensis]TWE07404.1 acyl-CoA synthetase (AMP-forming)/AMP-acid ligase II [Rudaeicoccus suwonensis]
MSGSEDLWDIFESSVGAFGDVTALDAGNRTWSYGTLHDQAIAVRQRLCGSIGLPAVLVVWGQNGADAIVAYLVGTSMGSTIVPIDGQLPVERVMSMLSALGGGVILTDRENELRDRIDGRWSIGTLDGRIDRLGAKSRAGEEPDAAYILFTSGTTGEPKGVPILGESVRAYVDHVRPIVGMIPGDRHSQNFSLSFDLSVHDMFITWASGATLVLREDRSHLLIDVYIRDRQLTHWFSVPSALTFTTHREHEPLDTNLRWAGFCGEALTYDQVASVRAWFPNSEIVNLYGPTELTIACSAYKLPPRVADEVATSNGTVPIGRVFPHLEWRTAKAEHGDMDFQELLLRGVQRFKGYVQQESNVKAFRAGDDRTLLGHVRDEDWYRTGDVVEIAEGEMLIHHGRLDDQVKVAGHRIEIADVEENLRRIDVLGGVAVVVLRSPEARLEGMATLCAFYTAPDVDVRIARQSLQERLPAYMIPHDFRHVKSIPLNANGKIDRAALVAVCAEPGHSGN